jgi:hypothetical protein
VVTLTIRRPIRQLAITDGEEGMTRVKRALALLGLVLLLAPVARAHEGGKHVRGVIREAAPDHLIVQTDAGDITVMLTPETQVARSGAPGDRSPPVAGERVVVHAKSSAGGRLDATEVKLPAKKAP